MSESNPTLNQKCVVKKIRKRLESGEKINIGDILQSCGYSETTAKKNPKRVMESDGVQTLLDRMVDDEEIIGRFNEILREGADRESIKAGDKLFNWKHPDRGEDDENTTNLNIKVTEK